MPYVPLQDVWARHGLAAVVFGSLVDAGFHPVSECDLYGWMHFYKWPLGSQRPVTIWVPSVELVEASAFLAATPSDLPSIENGGTASFWTVARAGTSVFFILWFALMFVVAI